MKINEVKHYIYSELKGTLITKLQKLKTLMTRRKCPHEKQKYLLHYSQMDLSLGTLLR